MDFINTPGYFLVLVYDYDRVPVILNLVIQSRA